MDKMDRDKYRREVEQDLRLDETAKEKLAAELRGEAPAPVSSDRAARAAEQPYLPGGQKTPAARSPRSVWKIAAPYAGLAASLVFVVAVVFHFLPGGGNNGLAAAGPGDGGASGTSTAAIASDETTTAATTQTLLEATSSQDGPPTTAPEDEPSTATAIDDLPPSTAPENLHRPTTPPPPAETTAAPATTTTTSPYDIMGENDIVVFNRIYDMLQVLLPAEDAERIHRILDGKTWNFFGEPACDRDCVFTLWGVDVGYHSDCGTFYNEWEGSSLELTEEERLEVNAILEKYIPLGHGYQWSTSTTMPTVTTRR